MGETGPGNPSFRKGVCEKHGGFFGSCPCMTPPAPRTQTEKAECPFTNGRGIKCSVNGEHSVHDFNPASWLGCTHGQGPCGICVPASGATPSNDDSASPPSGEAHQSQEQSSTPVDSIRSGIRTVGENPTRTLPLDHAYFPGDKCGESPPAPPPERRWTLLAESLRALEEKKP